jgi:proton-translocating NADH-quinone oxidoreductase chain N
MVEILDVVLPIISLATFAILTIPVFRVIRKTQHRTALAMAWFAAAFIVSGAAVANLALQYYSLASPSSALPFLSIPLADTALADFSSGFMIDGISVYMAIMFVSVSAVVLFYSVFYVDSSKRPSERYFAIMLLLTAALMGAVFSGDLLTLFIFWEAAAAGSSFLMIYKKDPVSLNSTLKYLVMIIIASAFIVFGLSIVYGLTGSLNFWAVRNALMVLADKNLLIIAFILIATGYAIEAAIVPFHFWLPDAYAAAPSSSAAFLSALIDQGSYYVLIRVLVFILTPPGVLNWTFMLAVMAALTMIVGNLFALIQDNVKRLIANICVADVGYNLVGITSITSVTSVATLGITGNLYFFLIGGITTALSFMAVGVISRYGFRTLEDFSGLGRKMPFVSLALVIAGLSFAGVPPLGGFMAKYLVFTAAIQANMSWLAVVGVLTSVLQVAYLLRLVNYMYAKNSKDETVIKEPKRLLIPIFILVAAIIILGVYPQIVFNLIDPVVKQFPFIP